MRFHKAILILGIFTIVLTINFQSQNARAQWYAGTWNSTIYNRAEKPRTVSMRFEIRDSDSDIPVPNVQITLQGYYIEERIGRSGDDVGIPYEPQQKEFRLRAATNKDGVAVFALGWQKEYPWRTFFGDHAPRENRTDGGYSIKDSWVRAVDDIEKVQQIEIRHPRYNYKKIPFNFKNLLKFGQDKKSQMQRPELFDKFKQAWQKEIKRKDVKFFVLNIGTKFPDFQNKKSKRPEFFEKIRREDWGTVYQRPYNWFSTGGAPQSECGPYFVYLFDEVPIERRTREIEISNYISSKVREPTPHDQPKKGTPSKKVFTKRLKFTGGAYGESVEWQETELYAFIQFKTCALRHPIIPEGFEGVAIEVMWNKGPRRDSKDAVVIFPDSRFPPGISGNLVDITRLKRKDGTYESLTTQSGEYTVSLTPTSHSSSYKNVMRLRGHNAGRNLRLHLFKHIDFLVEGVDDSKNDTLPVKHSQQERPTKESEIFRDDFLDAEIDNSLWEWGQTNEFSYRGREIQKFRVLEQEGQILLESFAAHERGWTSIQDVWLDSTIDLKHHGDVTIEIEISGSAEGGSGGFLDVLLSSGKIPTEHRDPKSIRLFSAFGNKNKALNLRRGKIKIEISESADTATAYVDGRVIDEYSDVDISSLSRWKLRFYVSTGTSAGFPSCLARMKIHSVRATEHLSNYDKNSDTRTVRSSEDDKEQRIKDLVTVSILIPDFEYARRHLNLGNIMGVRVRIEKVDSPQRDDSYNDVGPIFREEQTDRLTVYPVAYNFPIESTKLLNSGDVFKVALPPGEYVLHFALIHAQGGKMYGIIQNVKRVFSSGHYEIVPDVVK